jgi:hypothetical protein
MFKEKVNKDSVVGEHLLHLAKLVKPFNTLLGLAAVAVANYEPPPTQPYRFAGETGAGGVGDHVGVRGGDDLGVVGHRELPCPPLVRGPPHRPEHEIRPRRRRLHRPHHLLRLRGHQLRSQPRPARSLEHRHHAQPRPRRYGFLRSPVLPTNPRLSPDCSCRVGPGPLIPCQCMRIAPIRSYCI